MFAKYQFNIRYFPREQCKCIVLITTNYTPPVRIKQSKISDIVANIQK